ncbi:hypothetical protein MVEN_01701700 [Mycena venus]|uniref:Uncharacterized protein n=1 Tax=Mycena venus TaxID=2733690 RepID=A0A8H6XPI9_9AGAR|nr:hypothetical protein MVEN_01701700 [Mycena venus]
MAQAYPSINIEGFKIGVNDGIQIISKFFNEFQPVFEGAPDERGLTDQLLLAIAKKSSPGRIVLSRPSPQQEGQWGYDYLLKFSMRKNTATPFLQTENVAIYIQAKSFKTEIFGGVALEVADFTYTNTNGMQMDLLHAKVQAEKRADPSARIYGGYILYSKTDRNNMFLPLDDVRDAYQSTQRKAMTKDAANRAMSKEFIEARDRYLILSMPTYGA